MSKLLDETTPLARAADALAAPLDDKLLLMSVEQGSYFEFSAVTRRIWELLETPQNLGLLVASLIEEYEVDPEVCGREVRAVIEGLTAEGLVIAG